MEGARACISLRDCAHTCTRCLVRSMALQGRILVRRLNEILRALGKDGLYLVVFVRHLSDFAVAAVNRMKDAATPLFADAPRREH